LGNGKTEKGEEVKNSFTKDLTKKCLGSRQKGPVKAVGKRGGKARDGKNSQRS